MRASRHNAESEDHGIDLAPMLDFVLNLLIFFIITTSFIKEAGVTVFLTNAVTGEVRESGNIHIAIRENGDIWMEKKRVDLRQVRPILERLHIERPDDTVIVMGDAASPLSVLGDVMDEVRAAGLRGTAIATAPL